MAAGSFHLRVVHQLLVQSAGGQEAVEVLAIYADVELLSYDVIYHPTGARDSNKYREAGAGSEKDTNVS